MRSANCGGVGRQADLVAGLREEERREPRVVSGREGVDHAEAEHVAVELERAATLLT
jgi:hypothetical protein